MGVKGEEWLHSGHALCFLCRKGAGRRGGGSGPQILNSLTLLPPPLFGQGEREALPQRWPQPLRDVIAACWNQDPAQRPSFSRIVRELEALQVREEVCVYACVRACVRVCFVKGRVCVCGGGGEAVRRLACLLAIHLSVSLPVCLACSQMSKLLDHMQTAALVDVGCGCSIQ